MSSPLIMTSVRDPYQAASAANIEDTDMYLGRARTLYYQGQEAQKQCLALGGKLIEPPMTVAEAESRARELLHDGTAAGRNGVDFARAYWRTLKDSWFELVMRTHSELRATQAKRAQEEMARLEAVARQAAASFHLQVEVLVDRIQLSAPLVGASSHDQSIAVALQQLLGIADREGLELVAERAAAAASLPPNERLLALETFRIKLEQEVKERSRREALKIYRAEQERLAAERIRVSLAESRRKCEFLESEDAARLQAELEDLASSRSFADILEARVEAVEHQVIEATRQQSLLEAAVASLRQQGYETVQVMESLGPAQITSVYLQDGADEKRLALLQVVEGKGLISVETVRREDSNGSQQQRMRDTEAQARLCKAMDAVENALKGPWQLEMKKRLEPGMVEPKVNKNIAAKGRRTRVAKAVGGAQSLG